MLSFRSTTIVVLWVGVLFGQHAVPACGEIVSWVDWTSATAGNPGSASGTVTLPDSSTVSVSYSGEIKFAQTSGGTNYWIPSTPYLSATVENSPPTSDIVALIGGNSTLNTITFSEPVVNPVMAILSLGNRAEIIEYHFNAPFEILSFGPGYWGGPGLLTALPGNVVQGIEGHGTIRFLGNFSSISWTVPIRENWHGFTIGVNKTVSCPTSAPDARCLGGGSVGSGAPAALGSVVYGSPVALQNATATFSQQAYFGDWPVSQSIDGNFWGGWAIFDQTQPFPMYTSAQTAVWETTTDITAPQIEFTVHQLFSRHLIGRFRFSVTGDHRDSFADGAKTGGDVIANWTILTSPIITLPPGMTFSVLGDSSILTGGTVPVTGLYTLRFDLPFSNVTGVRLEVLEDPSLPFNGPGHEPSNGNLVLTELEVWTAAGDCATSSPDARCVQGSVAASGIFPPAGLDDFPTGAAFKVQMLDGTEVEIVGLGDPNTIIGRSDPFEEGDPADVCAPIFNGGAVPYPNTAACAPDPCVLPTGFPENSLGGQEIHTEILSLNLTDGLGNFVKAGQPFFDSVVGTPLERFYRNSFGEVQGLDNDFPGDSFFNVFVEVTVGAMKFYNKTPMVLRAEITQFPPDLSLPRSVYLHDPSFPPTPLFDANGLHVAYLLSAGHGSVGVTPPPAACDPPTRPASPVSFTLDNQGLGLFPSPLPNQVKDDEGVDVQQVTVYLSSGQTPGAPPDITNVRIDRLVGNIGASTPPAFAPGDAINSSSFGRDGTRDAADIATPGALLFSVDRRSSGDACSAVGLAAQSANPEQAADIYVAETTTFGAYSGPFLPTCPELSSNCLLADQTVLGLRPQLGGVGQDNLTALEASAFPLNGRFYGTFTGGSFDCGTDDCNTNGIPDGCEPDCNGNGVADQCDITAGTSLDTNGNGFPDECEPCGPACTTPPRTLRGATIFLYDDQGDPAANPFELGNLTVFAAAANLGLNERDVIDGLVLSDVTPGGVTSIPNGVMDPGEDEVLFSLAPGSPSLLGLDGAPGQGGVDDDGVNGIDDVGETGLGDDLSPADTFSSTFNGTHSIFVSHDRLGLLPTDNVDALDIGPTVSIVDCNCNGLDDACDVARVFSQDCNTNGTPDECERSGNDCNCNDIPDECDIAAGRSPDCNTNGIPDECEPDCNDNQIPDDCDIRDGRSADCNGNGIPDECEPDKDGDEVIDACDGCPNDPAKTQPGFCGCSNAPTVCPPLPCRRNVGCDPIIGCLYIFDCREPGDDCCPDDGNPCTHEVCDQATGTCGSTSDCTSPADCDDGLNCTVETCTDSCCEYNPLCPPDGVCCADGASCDDNNACTDDACGANGCCVNTPNPPCNDNIACTTDSCDPAMGCVFTRVNAQCNDGVDCTNDECNPSDPDANTETGCVNTPIVGQCPCNIRCPALGLCCDFATMTCQTPPCDVDCNRNGTVDSEE